MPSFWLGILIILALLNISEFFTGARWSPPLDYKPLWEYPWYNLSMLIWPALATGYRYSAVATRMTRSSLLEVLREDYVRTARAKGMAEKIIINRHALKNAMLPVVTVIGIEFAFLIGGLVVTEQVFNLNGIGRLLVQAVQNQDNVLAQALVMLIVLVFVVVTAGAMYFMSFAMKIMPSAKLNKATARMVHMGIQKMVVSLAASTPGRRATIIAAMAFAGFFGIWNFLEAMNASSSAAPTSPNFVRPSAAIAAVGHHRSTAPSYP